MKFLYAALLALVLCAPCFSQALTSGTDFLGVPTANVMPAGTIALTAFSFGPDWPYGGKTHESFGMTLGIADGLEINSSGSLDDVDIHNTLFGVKYNIEKSEQSSGWVKPAIFLYGLGEGRTGVPGIALTYDRPDSRFSMSTSGWFVDDAWECGVGAGYALGRGVRLVGEYSTDSKAFGGVELSYKWLVGRILKAESDDWFMEAGVCLPVW